MRRFVLLPVLLLAAAAVAQPDTSAGDRILGEWRGTSLCVNLDLAPACKDETVRYVFTENKGAENSYHQVADKLVDGVYQTMGEFDLVYSTAGETWSVEFTSRRCPVKCTWWYRLDESGLVGGLTDGSGEAVRKVEARRYEPDSAQAAAPRTLYLVRHGEYDHADPRPETEGKGLVPIGVAQARLLGTRLRDLGVRFDAFDASPLTRARQTAELLHDELPGSTVRIVPDLAECTPPTRRTEVVADEQPEEMAACATRLDRLFAERFVPSPEGDRHELLVAHGNVIRYLVTKALGVDTTAWLEMSVHNASLTEIRVEPDGRFKVIAVGDSGHLPPSLTTGATGDPERSLELPRP